MDYQITPIKSRILVSKKIDYLKNISSVLFMSESKPACNVLLHSVKKTIPDCIFISVYSLDHALTVCKHYYFDVILIDMENGIDLSRLVIIRKMQPTGYVFAFTRNSGKLGFLAGKGNVDDVIDSPVSQNVLRENILTGLSNAMGNRRRLAIGEYNINKDVFILRANNWRMRQILKGKIGFSARDYKTSRIKLKAIALLLLKQLTKTQITYYAGFSTVQKMILSLKRYPVVTID